MNEKPLIILIDDDRDVLEIYRSILEQNGYRTKVFLEPDEAFAFMETKKPDLVISDLMMESLDTGFSFCRRLKEDGRFADIPIIILTAVGGRLGYDFTPRTPEDLASMHVDAFLEKSLDIDEIVSTVRKLLDQREGRKKP